MTRRHSTAAALLVLAIVLAACTPAVNPGALASPGFPTDAPPSPAATTASPLASAGSPSAPPASASTPGAEQTGGPGSTDGGSSSSPSAAPSDGPGAAGTPARATATATPVPTASPLTEARAVALVLQTDPRFTDLPRRDAGAIGQGSWYDVARSGSGYAVTVTIGWGDCPSGCIYIHRWTFTVDARGHVTLAGESGDPLETASPGVTGFVTAAPTCPVERNPPDPACAPRPVSGAVLVVRRAAGTEVARTTSAKDGSYRLDLAPGPYLLVPQPVTGLIGTPQPVGFRVPDGATDPVRVDIQYDTGIR